MHRRGGRGLWMTAVATLAAGLTVLSVAAGADLSATVAVPIPSSETIRYYQTGNLLWILSNAWALLVPAVIFFSGLSVRLRVLAQRLGRSGFGTLVVYAVMFVAILFIADIGLDYIVDYLRPHKYGLSAQTLGKWLHDEAISLLLNMLAAALFLWIPYLLLKRSPQRWWLYTWAASIPLLIFLAFVEPIWIAPLFNDFGPLQDAKLETRILDLAHRAGIEGAKVFEVNKSVDTNEANAYVTGIGATKRIVLWDTTLKNYTPDQILAVLGHEMGHFVLNHVQQGVLFGIAGLLVALWWVHRCAAWVLRRFGSRTGVAELADIASLPLLMLILQAFALGLSPIPLAVSRHMEHEADRFGLEITHDNYDCATTFVKFVRDDLAYPTPGLLYKLWRSSHPSIAERIEFCNTYHPWRDGGPERYASYFKPAAR
jgi:Zn-dependent protease with chaperone function